MAKSQIDGGKLWHHAHLLQTDPNLGTCVIEWTKRKQSGQKRKSYEGLENEIVSLPLDSIHLLRLCDDNDICTDDECDSVLISDPQSSDSSSSGEDDTWDVKVISDKDHELIDQKPKCTQKVSFSHWYFFCLENNMHNRLN